MDMVLRGLAIAIEVIILAAITYTVLKGVKLAIFDMGLNRRYNMMVTSVFLIVGTIIVVFFIAHLTFLYPAI